jgi:hypothetical protein
MRGFEKQQLAPQFDSEQGERPQLCTWPLTSASKPLKTPRLPPQPSPIAASTGLPNDFMMAAGARRRGWRRLC